MWFHLGCNHDNKWFLSRYHILLLFSNRKVVTRSVSHINDCMNQAVLDDSLIHVVLCDSRCTKWVIEFSVIHIVLCESHSFFWKQYYSSHGFYRRDVIYVVLGESSRFMWITLYNVSHWVLRDSHTTQWLISSTSMNSYSRCRVQENLFLTFTHKIYFQVLQRGDKQLLVVN